MKNNISLSAPITLLVLSASFLLGAGSLLEKDIAEEISNEKTQRLYIDLTSFTPLSDAVFDSVEFRESTLKVVAYYKSSCSICVGELLQWKSIWKEIVDELNLPVLLITRGKSFEDAQYSALNVIKFPYPLFYDPENVFWMTNEIPIENNGDTYLIDQQNRVLFQGDVAMHESNLKKFKKAVRKYRKSNG
ncbi:MAG: hypothetical protein AAGI38_17365 [Bacteroidota bacterium]